jgi:hypothetical protein
MLHATFSSFRLVGVLSLFVAGPAFAGPTIEVIDSGSGPKQVLSFAPVTGATQTAEMRMKMGMKMSMAGSQMPEQDLPAMIMTMMSTVEKVESNGDIHYSFTVSDAGVDAGGNPMVVDAMKEQIQGIVGLKGTSIVDAQGIPKDVKYDLPADADASLKETYAQMSDSLDQMGAPLPKSAVGVGAKWRVVQKVEQRGMSIDQIVNYELKELKGSNVKVSISLEQTAPAQDVNAPGMPPGAAAKLLSLKSNGTGILDIDLTQMFPLQSNLDLSSAMQMQISAQGQDMEMGMEMDMGMSLTTK